MINLIATAEAAVILLVFRRFLYSDFKYKNLITSLISGALLGFNIYRYIDQSLEQGFIRIPVEFSAVAYFLVPIIVLLRLPALKVWAAYSALLAGGGYFLSIAFFGETVYKDYKPSSIAIALICHGALLIIGLLIISEKRFSPYSAWVITTGLIYVSMRAFLLRERFSGGYGIFIYELLFAFRPARIFGGGILPLYYLALFLLVVLSFGIFYRLNNKLAKK